MEKFSASARGEIMIDRPVQDVWEWLLKFPPHAPTVKTAELVSGEWDKQGRVLLITKKHAMAPFYLKCIKMDPCKQLVNKIDTKDNDTARCISDTFNDITLREVDGKTLVMFSNFATYAPQGEYSLDFDIVQGPKADEGMQSGFLKPLKEFVENNC